ncbi:hypothetical protein C8J57DRAFT_1245976 [Mycena rebaudengoi]|nr:hypothetical protein C8J57DRAFT_1245976 [Mycena rebaudengoi]
MFHQLFIATVAAIALVQAYWDGQQVLGRRGDQGQQQYGVDPRRLEAERARERMRRPDVLKFTDNGVQKAVRIPSTDGALKEMIEFMKANNFTIPPPNQNRKSS